VPTVRRGRRLRANPDEIWAIVGDPYHLPRWWPRVTITLAQRLRGLGLFGGFMVRSAGRRQLDGALDGLEALVTPQR